jgi:hypothetical protein
VWGGCMPYKEAHDEVHEWMEPQGGAYIEFLADFQ